MARQECEPLIHLNKISAFPRDARHVLHIRSEVQQELASKGGKQGPVDDLTIEENRADLQVEGSQVVHPIAFMLPTVVLKFLSRLELR